jgi:uncharacterized protein YqjF (DUF2071 family)
MLFARNAAELSSTRGIADKLDLMPPHASYPSNIFLSAEWRDLVLLNYSVDPGLLWPHVPEGTALDSFDGKTYLSLVGFRFCMTELWGVISIPFHSEFEEVNLRFYVHRNVGNEVRRGVVFIKEIVPKPLIALTARIVYGENYVSLPMKNEITANGDKSEIEYSWKHANNWSQLFARSFTAAKLPAEGSLEQYITEHYWGYSRQKSGATLEYHVAHAPWNVSVATEAGFNGDVGGLYGKDFANVLGKSPDSAYIANGSAVTVYSGTKIR